MKSCHSSPRFTYTRTINIKHWFEYQQLQTYGPISLESTWFFSSSNEMRSTNFAKRQNIPFQKENKNTLSKRRKSWERYFSGVQVFVLSFKEKRIRITHAQKIRQDTGIVIKNGKLFPHFCAKTGMAINEEILDGKKNISLRC